MSLLVNKRTKCIFLLKFLLYIALFACFMVFYFYDQMDEFMKGHTTFTRSYAKVESLAMPSIIFCMPGIKTSTKEKYGYHSNVEITLDKEEKFLNFNTTPRKIAEDLYFLLSKDFDLSMEFYQGETYPLSKGMNKIKDKQIYVKDLWTGLGICYLIEPKFERNINESPWIALHIRPKENYIKEEQNYHVRIFFASNNTWPGIYLYSWQYLTVPKVSVPLNTGIESLIEVTPQKIQFQNGIKDVENCMKDIIMSFNCTFLCSPISMNYIVDLPDCTSYKEMECMAYYGMWDPKSEAHLAQCLRPANSLVFMAQILGLRLASAADNVSTIWFKYSNGQLAVKEEVPSLGLTSFIGSIGGSLGLFLGFSIFDYISKCIHSTISALLK